MGLLDSSTLTVNAILTTRGRELLSTEGDIDITKYALSDEEIDYTLHDRKHPNGTSSFGVILDNSTLLEASPNRTKFNSYLLNEGMDMTGQNIFLSEDTYTGIDGETLIAIVPKTVGGANGEDYTFTIENTNILKFAASGIGELDSNVTDATDLADSNPVIAKDINVMTQIVSTDKQDSEGGHYPATTTITVTGKDSGITKVISVEVKNVRNSWLSTAPINTNVDVTDSKFY